MTTEEHHDNDDQHNGNGHDDDTVEIIVNASEIQFKGEEISYEQVVNYAFDNNPPTGPDVSITVNYAEGVDDAEGSLRPGNSIKVTDNMVFYVKATNKS